MARIDASQDWHPPDHGSFAYDSRPIPDTEVKTSTSSVTIASLTSATDSMASRAFLPSPGRFLIDARGRYLRLGPAPYLSDAQLEAALKYVREHAKPPQSE